MSESDSSEIDSETDTDSTSDQEIEPPILGQIQPYQYEPMVSETEAVADSENTQHGIPVDIARIGHKEWCECGCCETMLSVEECNCCQEVDIVREKIPEGADCILQHPAFKNCCQDPWVLSLAYQSYKERHGGVDKELHQKYRYVAYRQFVRLIWGFLGKDIRVPLPSCVVSCIRQTFRSCDYTGFKDVPM